MTFKAEMEYEELFGTFYIEIQADSESRAEYLAKRIAKKLGANFLMLEKV